MTGDLEASAVAASHIGTLSTSEPVIRTMWTGEVDTPIVTFTDGAVASLQNS